MANTTTISISRRFQNWLKGKGKKGESYEEIIKSLLKPEALKELENYRESLTIKETNEKSDIKKEPDIIDTMFEGKLT